MQEGPARCRKAIAIFDPSPHPVNGVALLAYSVALYCAVLHRSRALAPAHGILRDVRRCKGTGFAAPGGHRAVRDDGSTAPRSGVGVATL